MKEEKGSKHNLRLIILFSLFIVLFGSCSSSETEDLLLSNLLFTVTFSELPEYLSVNGSEVAAPEIKLIAQIQIDQLMGRFGHLGDPAENPRAWLGQDGENPSPIEVLRNRTLAEVVRTRVILEQAVDLSIRADISFEAFQRRWQVENLNRKEKEAKGEALYGPVEYSFPEYFSLDLRSLELALMQRLEEKDLLKQAESFWDPNKGGTRRERIERLYKKYIEMEVSQASVLLNRPAFESFDLFTDPFD